MVNASARLARRITWAASKQSYLTARLLADPGLADDCLRAYAYFRWADDTIDLALQTLEARTAFIDRQRTLIDRLYQHDHPSGLTPEEDMLADLIEHDRGHKGGLRSFIENFMAVIEFDAYRRGKPISQKELAGYTACLGTAVMDGLLYFIGNGHTYPRTTKRTLAVIGAHLTHMLRDTLEDLPAGFINIPAEEITARRIDLDRPESEPFRQWVQVQVQAARACLGAGKSYIDSLDVLRARLAGVWYCARFDCVLDAIERDGYVLRRDYPERKCLAAWLNMFFLAGQVVLQHTLQRLRQAYLPLPTRVEFEPKTERIQGQSF
jgi:phytoene/squalene synthetase